MAAAHRRPDIGEYYWLLRAFYDLSTCRSVGMAVGPIPFTAIAFYVDRYALPQWCIDAVLQIDRSWLEMMNDE